ncbi:MAG: WecB/TagA/CpsF family glycosyltransferase [Pirellulaceae bacterium]|nr:WecB/TagA/CpsF family glycosyltransferase [Pirellulaceae bacterium]
MSNTAFNLTPSPTGSVEDSTFVLNAWALPKSAPAGDTTPPDRQIYAETTDVWDTPFAVIDMQGTLKLADDIVRARRPEYFVTANLNYLMLVETCPQLVEINRRAAAVLADGNPIVWRSRLGVTPLPCRVAGSDLILELAKLSADRGYKIFLLGAAEGVAAKAAAELHSRNPQLQIAGTYSPPFRTLSSEETEDLLAQVNQSGADILLVAFGQPKGELWIYEHLSKLQVPLSIQLGASFDFLAGTAKRAPRVWQQLGLEWLYRALSDPKRLGPRYAANLSYLLRRMFADMRAMFR